MQDLEALIARLPGDEAELRRSDEATRQGAVLPVLKSLGWDHQNLSEVPPQVPVRNRRVSYGLRAGGRTLAFVEARRAGDDLAKRQQWFVEAAAGAGVPLAALTDGLAWRLYLSAEAAGIEQRLVCAVDFRSDPPARAAAGIRRFIGRDAVVGGEALEAAKREFERRERDRAALSRVWRRIVTGPTDTYGDTLHDLLAEAVEVEAGRRPEREAVHRFLLGTLPGDHAPPEVLGTSDPAIFKGLRPAAFWLDGVRHEVANWRAVLAGTCKLLVQEAGLRRFVQAVGPIRGKSFSADRSQLRTPTEIAEGRFFVEGNVSAAAAVRRAREALIAVRGPHGAEGFTIEPASPRRRRAPGRQAGADGRTDYMGKRPAAFRLDGVRHEVANWRAVLVGACELLVQEAGFRRFAQAVEPIRGKKRVFFSADRSQLHTPIEISPGDFFVEGKLSANAVVRLARRVIEAVRGPHGAEGFAVEPAE